MNINAMIARELGVAENRVRAAVELLDEGATVPFVARYRKEATGGLDDTQLRLLAERLHYLRELAERKKTVEKSINEQGRMTPQLQAALDAADNKTALEDLYLPYKPKRRTKAQMARDHGLQPLADLLFSRHDTDPETAAADFTGKDVADTKAALDGARAILIEQFSEDAELIGRLREKLWRTGMLHAQVEAGKEAAGEKFKDYFNHEEALCRMPGHRALAVLRGRNEGILSVHMRYRPDDLPASARSSYEEDIARRFGIPETASGAGKWLSDTVRLAWRGKIFPSLETDLLGRLKEAADRDAITVFARNLKDLLLAAPAGRLPTLGLDPGIRTGVKVAAVDDTGKLSDTATVYPHPPRNDWDGALHTLETLVKKHGIRLIAVGNGTAARETDKLAGDLIKRLPDAGLQKIMVSEAGASVYSASETAAQEFPDLDVSLRGAVSIARRLQDPLAELVKIDPKSIGVGQYQHDINQNRLAESLDAVVEDCVNAVGVDVNTASVPLLARVSGLNPALARNIVGYRDEHGAFPNRKMLLKVPRLGEKTFEQAAGFLRIYGGSEPLDAGGVHPEAYPLVSRMLSAAGLKAAEAVGNRQAVSAIRAADFVDERFGLPTITDILAELEKPGRDPRGTFKTARFAEGVEKISDLRPGMVLEGVVSNVANFGAFVDIGVHQDGLVHISALADQYVADPHTVVKAGDIVRVRVVEVDASRKRIALSMRSDDEAGKPSERPAGAQRKPASPKHTDKRPGNSAMADAFASLVKKSGS